VRETSTDSDPTVQVCTSPTASAADGPRNSQLPVNTPAISAANTAGSV
jgi:hypothetical protein